MRDCFHLYTQKWIGSQSVAVKDWLIQHYNIEENLVWVHKPFYYYHTMSKAVSFWNHNYENEKGKKGLEERAFSFESTNKGWLLGK